ncbi:MAG: DUF2057 family protein [Oceanospirillaceae bacterium]|nr:DUF2057 family protein [Oceanospirillaceae bacterium]MCP5335151.1 DUF2057 family protein [Oceanospirillaceae bacterium]MCP5351487.1 DUF2057 family protein [Oceanospirillaceae bacterium]
MQLKFKTPSRTVMDGQSRHLSRPAKLHSMAACAFAVLFLSGCAQQGTVKLYDGPSLPPELTGSISLPLTLEPQQIDGNSISQGLYRFRNGPMQLSLNKGKHQLIVRYDNIVNITSDEHEHLVSMPMVLDFEIQGGEQGQIVLPGNLTQLPDIRAYVAEPKVTLQLNGQNIDSLQLKNERQLSLQEVKTSTAGNTPQLQQLQFWWQQASEYERVLFMRWLKEQGNPDAVSDH